jgi:hypothetical protein
MTSADAFRLVSALIFALSLAKLGAAVFTEECLRSLGGVEDYVPPADGSNPCPPLSEEETRRQRRASPQLDPRLFNYSQLGVSRGLGPALG